MRFISGLLRILLGLGVMGFAAYIYLLHQVELSGTKAIHVSLVGEEFDAEPHLIIYGIFGAGVIGLLLVLAGVITLLRSPAAQPPPGSSPDGSQPPAAA